MLEQPKKWRFEVVVMQANGMPRVFGRAETYEDAIKLRDNATSDAVGWYVAGIYDRDLKEVKKSRTTKVAAGAVAVPPP